MTNLHSTAESTLVYDILSQMDHCSIGQLSEDRLVFLQACYAMLQLSLTQKGIPKVVDNTACLMYYRRVGNTEWDNGWD